MTGGKRNRKPHQCCSRLAVADYIMKGFQCPDRSKYYEDKTAAEIEAERTVVIANVHLHHAVANLSNKLKEKEERLKEFFDALAQVVMTYKVRLITGDFNMATVIAVTEMRARGFCANVTSWFAWLKTGGEPPHAQDETILGDPWVKLDSVLIMVIGPVNGVRLPYDQRAFNMPPPSAVAECCRNVQGHVRDKKTGKDERIFDYTLQGYANNGSGHQLSSYRPANPVVKRELVMWMNTKIPWSRNTIGTDEIAWLQFKEFMTEYKVKKLPVVTGNNVDMSIGDDTWSWPRYPMCKCKPQIIFHFENGQQVFNTGSHIPLIVFIGDASDSARGDQSWTDRQGKAKNRVHKDGGGFDMPSIRAREKKAKEKEDKKFYGGDQQDERSQPQRGGDQQWWNQNQWW